MFITTKLPPGAAGRERRTLDSSLPELGMDHVDLWLVHWPPRARALVSTWKELLAVRDQGLARAVGVSNYRTAQLDELIAATGQTPQVNQIPWAPALYDAALLGEHRRRGVVLEGYSPFKNTDLRHPVLVEIAALHGVTPAQVVVRWHVDHEVVVIPKSATPERIAANFDVIRLLPHQRGAGSHRPAIDHSTPVAVLCQRRAGRANRARVAAVVVATRRPGARGGCWSGSGHRCPPAARPMRTPRPWWEQQTGSSWRCKASVRMLRDGRGS